jgi:hypothetical protein
VPTPGVLDRLVGAILPQEGPVFLKQAFKGRAPRLHA